MKYFDLQVNGYAGVDFNRDDLDVDSIAQACQRLQDDGVTSILATIITDELPVMCRRLRALAVACERSDEVRAMIHGMHIEGPFLNESPGYIGAHPAAAARPADRDSMQQLLDAASGLTRLVTLAPERDPNSQVTRFLADQGIRVSAGHCDPTYDELRQAIDAGLTMFTHLGNGCPLQLHRHDNIIQRVLSLADELWIGWIADGVHVPAFALKNYLCAAGIERSYVVTDATAAAGLGPGTYQLGGQPVVVDERLATWSADRSHLMGSAVTMPRATSVLTQEVGLSADDVHRLTWSNPLRIMGLAD